MRGHFYNTLGKLKFKLLILRIFQFNKTMKFTLDSGRLAIEFNLTF
jgi:hypothetical protein